MIFSLQCKGMRPAFHKFLRLYTDHAPPSQQLQFGLLFSRTPWASRPTLPYCVSFGDLFKPGGDSVS
jgi:hypothetical protein